MKTTDGSNGAALERLSPKHRAFVTEFMSDFNATQAYVRAGYAARGARQNASRLMTNDSVLAAIEEQVGEHRITVDRISIKLAEIGFDDSQQTRDQISALDKLARIRGLVTEKHEHRVATEITVPWNPVDLAALRAAKRAEVDAEGAAGEG